MARRQVSRLEAQKLAPNPRPPGLPGDSLSAVRALPRRLPFGRRVPVALAPDVALEVLAAVAVGPLREAAARELELREGSDRSGLRVSLGELAE